MVACKKQSNYLRRSCTAFSVIFFKTVVTCMGACKRGFRERRWKRDIERDEKKNATKKFEIYLEKEKGDIIILS